MKKPAILSNYKTLLRYMREHRAQYFWGIVSLIITGAAQLLVPQFIRQAVDIFTLTSFEIIDILRIVGGLIVTAIFVALGRFGWRFFIGSSARNIERKIRKDLFDHLMSLDNTFYQQNSIGDLMARSTNDMQTIRMASGIGIVSIFDALLLSISALAIIFTQTPRLAAYVIIPLPFIAIFIFVFGRLIGPVFRSVQEGFADMSNHSQETFAGIRVIKSFVKEKFFFNKFNALNKVYRSRNMQLVSIFGLFFPIVSFLSGITISILLYVGGRQVINYEITPGDLVATLSYLQLLIWPMIGAGFTVNLVQRGAASLERINKILFYRPMIENKAEGITPDLSGNICIENLNYSVVDNHILKGISLQVDRGEFIGITGPVGGGKSTLLNCLPRLIHYSGGKILLNGHEAQEVDLFHLRKHFSYVPQNSFLFSARLRDNIAFGVDSMSEPELEKFVSIAGLDRDYKLFPEGWNTVVGEKGVTISGGQKQRSSLARALAMNADVLLLDDPLSAVDADTEERILTALLKHLEGITTFIVSHRISTLKHCDKIFVIENGTISQSGKHEDLIHQDGYYHKIFEIQKASSGLTKQNSAKDGQKKLRSTVHRGTT